MMTREIPPDGELHYQIWYYGWLDVGVIMFNMWRGEKRLLLLKGNENDDT